MINYDLNFCFVPLCEKNDERKKCHLPFVLIRKSPAFKKKFFFQRRNNALFIFHYQNVDDDDDDEVDFEREK